MEMKYLLQNLDVGSSVAEFDRGLERYFVETPTFRALVSDKADVIAGDKGTGKTALFQILQKRHGQISELKDIVILPGFNPTGNPVFQRLAQQPPLKEAEYATIWKAYVLSLVGNWLLRLYDGTFTENMKKLDELLRKLNMRSEDDAANTIFSKILNTLARFFKPSAAQTEFTFHESGLPIFKARVEYNESEQDKKSEVPQIVSHEEALTLLERSLEDAELTVWIILDRLDEAFQGFPDTEVPALRALFRTYLDLLPFTRVRLKLFVRKDLFRKITQGGFVNLTHINARKTEIVWLPEDLLNLLCQRLKRNEEFIKTLDLANAANEVVFNRIFPKQVDAGKRRPQTWAWIQTRIWDGNRVSPPRNLIDLISMATEEQLRKEGREPRQVEPELPVIEGESLRRALTRLSETRVNDTLLAEAGEAAAMIERFRDGKAEHNEETLRKLLGLDALNVRVLVELGFLEDLKGTYKVPMLYRDGLSITQGKAFSSSATEDDDEE